ncbi:hypothetical protein CKAN_00686100 [Cinnamomum micranthum f. kanehirae]|uniref:Hydroxyproline-rich glycoprotein family protein n=1 Tax=Cinnamomum micranthum f. kanehirae TaxID=337451 RepID=A0A3S3MRJ5_9MAGN|nr:hypothetical protein CKAN_00686100 [Cinnamomum micranthum f. kanehirae]
MAGNGRMGSGRSGGASISAAATAFGSSETRFPLEERRRRWGGCWGGLPCFGSQKKGKRIVPASRIPDGNTSTNRANGPQPVGLPNQATSIAPSLLAPPSSPASFSNSALPSTAQSPSCFLSLSANSPGGPSSTMFATGPYANEPQLVSPPVFSTFTTEPSTAPLTPPPELAHPTTPSSPDVPFARLLSSSMDLNTAGKEKGVPFMSSGYVSGGDLQAMYPLYPESPASSLISPRSGTPGDGQSSPFPERELATQWGSSVSSQDSHYPGNASSKLFGLNTSASNNFMLPQDSSFFCPATSAQFYLDQAQQSFPSYPHSEGRLSLSREADIYTSGGNAHQNRHDKNCKTDVEEIEAYRASFGFSADEIISTPQYVEISDVHDDSFTMAPFATNKPHMEDYAASGFLSGLAKIQTAQLNLVDAKKGMASTPGHFVDSVDGKAQDLCNGSSDPKSLKQSGNTCGPKDSGIDVQSSIEELISMTGDIKIGQRSRSSGLSISDTEVDYRRGRSVREGNGHLSWN